MVATFNPERGGLLTSASPRKDHHLKVGKDSFPDIGGPNAPGETLRDCFHDLLHIAGSASPDPAAVVKGDPEGRILPPGESHGGGIRPKHSEVLEEGPHHHAVLAGPKRKWLLPGGSLQDQGVGPEAFRGGAGETSIGGSPQGDEVLTGICDGCICGGQHPGHDRTGALVPRA